jgi:hypothetical protein
MSDYELTISDEWKIRDALFDLRTRRTSLASRLQLHLPGPLRPSFDLSPPFGLEGLEGIEVVEERHPALVTTPSRPSGRGALDSVLEQFRVRNGAVRLWRGWGGAPDFNFARGNYGLRFRLDW